MERPVFVALVEVVPIAVDALGDGVLGGMVRGYTPAANEDEAIKLIAAELGAAGVRLVRIEWCVNEREVTWDDADSLAAKEHILAALKRGGPVLSEFHVWTTEEEE